MYALHNNSAANYNTAVGYKALETNTAGTYNTAVGYNALEANTADYNTAIGGKALAASTAGYNTAIGSKTLSSLASGTFNTVLGYEAGSNYTSTEEFNICIANNGLAGDTFTTRIGTIGGPGTAACFVAGIANVTIPTGTNVFIDLTTGQLGTATSSRNYKKDIQTLETQTEKMLKLRPVSFVYKEDSKNAKQFGLIAEEVGEIYPELIRYDGDGNIRTIDYMQLIPLLLKQIQDLQLKLHEQEMANQELQIRYDIQAQEQGQKLNKLSALVTRLLEFNGLPQEVGL